MKIKLLQDHSVREVEVSIAYDKMNRRLQSMIKSIRQYEYRLQVHKEERIYFIPLEEVLYAEFVDRHTFLYTKEAIYESDNNLMELEKLLENTTILRIGKTVLLNVTHLLCVKPYPNHRLMAELSNGEKLIVSRKYIDNLREKVRRSYSE